MSKIKEIPIWEKITLSVEETAALFRIGEGKLCKIINENPEAAYILWNGSRPQIKRKQFEALIERINAI